MFSKLDELRWRSVPQLVREYAEKSASKAQAVQELMLAYPAAGISQIDYSPDTDNLRIKTSSVLASVPPACLAGLEEIAPVTTSKAANTWVPAFFRPYSEKTALDLPAPRDVARGVGQAALMFDSPVSKYIPGAPSPLAATIAGGVLGAGAGYGTGWLLNKLQPRDWQQERTRRLATLLGAGLGATPGLIGMGFNVANNLPVTDPGPMGGSPTPFDPAFKYKSPWPTYKAAEEALGVELDAEHAKIANSYTGAGGPSVYVPTGYIPYEAFNASIWNDSRVADRLPAGQQAALSGLLTGASHVSNTPKLISPMDIAKVTMGMGSGYVSGAIVGKALGLMTGMSPSSQEKLKNTGMWAGLLANMVPIAFAR